MFVNVHQIGLSSLYYVHIFVLLHIFPNFLSLFSVALAVFTIVQRIAHYEITRELLHK